MNYQQKFDSGEIIEFARPTLVLASASPRRQRLLQDAGITFIQILSDFDDTTLNDEYPHEGVSQRDEVKYARAMALAKLQPFLGRITNGAVITADTTALCEGRVLEKPLTKEKCREQHRFLSGKWHEIYTSYAVHYNGKTICRVMKSRVKIDHLSDEIIETICSEEGTLKCAGYKSAGAINPYVHFKNDRHRANVEGLDPHFLCKLLRKVGFRTLP